MKCADCRFYAPGYYEYLGTCEIKLPPHLAQASESCSDMVHINDECDLGQAKQVEAEK